MIHGVCKTADYGSWLVLLLPDNFWLFSYLVNLSKYDHSQKTSCKLACPF